MGRRLPSHKGASPRRLGPGPLKIHIDLDADLHRGLKARADANERTMVAEARVILRQVLHLEGQP
jgi:plasmid stability protein